MTAARHRSPLLRFVCVMALIRAILPAQAAPAHGAKPAPAFTLASKDRMCWLVTPDGKRFFSLGVCCVTPGDDWLDYKPANPGYAAWQHYPDAEAWADATLERLTSWGFTTIGGWSDYATLRLARPMPMYFAPVLSLGASSGAPWRDMWDPTVIRTMEEVAERQIVPLRDDARLLGYYTDNEIGWWNAALFKMTLEQPAHSEQRRRLVRMLRAQYQNDWRRLGRDFVPVRASSFQALDRAGTLYLRPGGGGIQAIKRFVGMAAERYYSLVRQVVRKYDPRGLLLGDRYQSFYYPEVARAARDHVDVISTNLNPGWLDGSFVRFYLDTLHSLTQRPVIVSEFYMTSQENGSGNHNDSSGFPVVATQRERADSFRRTLDALVEDPAVVGADWFQYYDEPARGRGDGENYDMGLVDIHDRPYPQLTAAAAALDREAIHAHPAARQSVLEGVPPAPRDPAASWKAMEALQGWDRERGFVPPRSADPVSDLYLCWNEDAIYVGLYAIDIVEPLYYQDGRVPEADRAELTLRIGERARPIHIRLGAGRRPEVTGQAVDVVGLSGLEHDARNIAVVKLPAALFGRPKLSAGDVIHISADLLTHARAYRVSWSGDYRIAD